MKLNGKPKDIQESINKINSQTGFEVGYLNGKVLTMKAGEGVAIDYFSVEDGKLHVGSDTL